MKGWETSVVQFSNLHVPNTHHVFKLIVLRKKCDSLNMCICSSTALNFLQLFGDDRRNDS